MRAKTDTPASLDIGLLLYPGVQRAAARVEETYLALARTAIPAPIGGLVARRSVQIGQRVAAGAPLMAVVPP